MYKNRICSDRCGWGSLCVCVCVLMGVGCWASNKACYLEFGHSCQTPVWGSHRGSVSLSTAILSSHQGTSVPPFFPETCAFNWLSAVCPSLARRERLVGKYAGKWEMLIDWYERSFCLFILLASLLKQHLTLQCINISAEHNLLYDLKAKVRMASYVKLPKIYSKYINSVTIYTPSGGFKSSLVKK